MKKLMIATLALFAVFSVNAASIGGNTSVGTSNSTYTGNTHGVENKVVTTHSDNSLGGAHVIKHDVMDTNSKYSGGIHGSSNKAFTSVTADGLTGTEVTTSSYTGASHSGSHIKYVDKYTSSGWEDNSFSGPLGTEVTHATYNGSGKTKRNVDSHSNSVDSGWSVEW